ncbi:MAG: polysaccharide biosynthesis/export family protein [Thermoanaerobaculia bacterium]
MMMKRIKRGSLSCNSLASIFLLLTSSVSLGAQETQGTAEVSTSQSSNYVIGVSDVLTLSVWREDQLQVTVPVRPDGRIVVPLLGEIEVVGRTPMEVQADLTKGYEEFVTAPAVSLVVTEINSRKVYVLGEVKEPGVFDILRPIKLLQVLAMAGGFTDFAKKDEVVVIREGTQGDLRFEFSVKAITTGRSPEDNILLFPGDTIYVP